MKNLKRTLYCLLIMVMITMLTTNVFAIESAEVEKIITPYTCDIDDTITFKSEIITDMNMLEEYIDLGIKSFSIKDGQLNVEAYQLSAFNNTDEDSSESTTESIQQKIMERTTSDGQVISTYANTTIYTNMKATAHDEGGAKIRLNTTFDTYYLNNVQYFSPKTIVTTYVNNTNQGGYVVTAMRSRCYFTKEYYTSNGTVKEKNQANSTKYDGPLKSNPAIGSSVTQTYKYGGTRFYPKNNFTIYGRYTIEGSSVEFKQPF